MSYIVVYQREDGVSSVEECGDLDLAIVTAERLRNVDAIERPRIFKTEEITYDFKPYYRVEVVSAEATTPSAAAPTPPPPVPVAEPAEESKTENVVEKKIADKKAAAAADVDTAVSSSADDSGDGASSGSGLYSDGSSVTDEMPDADLADVAADVAEETAEAAPPRRGLFGR